jgi:hypothetical protein
VDAADVVRMNNRHLMMDVNRPGGFLPWVDDLTAGDCPKVVYRTAVWLCSYSGYAKTSVIIRMIASPKQEGLGLRKPKNGGILRV